VDYTRWEPPPPRPRRQSPLALTALWLAVASFLLLFVAYLGWIADVVVGPVAFGVSVAATVRTAVKGADRGLALGALALSLPALAWAVYALAGGQLR
jgi:hypothetical protein